MYLTITHLQEYDETDLSQNLLHIVEELLKTGIICNYFLVGSAPTSNNFLTICLCPDLAAT